MGISTELGVPICSSKARSILIGIRGCHKNGWKKTEIDETVDLGEPTSSLDHVLLGCSQRECNPNESIIDEDR